jgi:hypothetical protein
MPEQIAPGARQGSGPGVEDKERVAQGGAQLKLRGDAATGPMTQALASGGDEMSGISRPHH